MTANVNIKRGDLHLAVSTAFNRGRYVLMTDGGGQPVEITIDLRERPDDLFEAEEAREHMRNIGKWSPFEIEPGFRDGLTPSDDHGPSVPAQGGLYQTGGVRVYEFAVGDITHGPLHLSLATVELADAPDQEAAECAQWVHVYDRVTRERRTLKRPEPDRILTGLRDVAADLRAERGAEVFTPARGAPVDPPFGCAALPPVGPLTSTEGLRAGDVLRVIDASGGTGLTDGQIVRVVEPVKGRYVCHSANGIGHFFERFAFVGRPDSDGWMTWAGGENPAGTAPVEWFNRDGASGRCLASELAGWGWPYLGGGGDVVRFRIVDTPPAV